MGGRRPLTFLVDGAPLAADPARREAAWQPPGPGFYRLTVLDADGSRGAGRGAGEMIPGIPPPRRRARPAIHARTRPGGFHPGPPAAKSRP